MLELRGISKHWGQQVLANQLNLTVAAGQTVAVLGPSGTGKSTLLRIVAGLEPSSAGSVWFDGQDLTPIAPEARRFALMFQDFALFPHLNVLDNVAFGLIEQGQTKTQARTHAHTLLHRFGLAQHAHAKTWVLSGGEQQRVALARALITQPRVLLLDEPFSALDTQLRSSLRQEFSQRITAAGIVCIIVTHDETEARLMGNSGYTLNAGHIHRIW